MFAHILLGKVISNCINHITVCLFDINYKMFDILLLNCCLIILKRIFYLRWGQVLWTWRLCLLLQASLTLFSKPLFFAHLIRVLSSKPLHAWIKPTVCTWFCSWSEYAWSVTNRSFYWLCLLQSFSELYLKCSIVVCLNPRSGCSEHWKQPCPRAPSF